MTQAKRWRNFFFFEYYRVQLDSLYTFPDGRCGMGSFANNVMSDANEVTIVAVPVPTGINTLEFTQVESWIVRPWDNVSAPFKLPSSHFVFEPPLVRFEEARLPADGPPCPPLIR